MTEKNKPGRPVDGYLHIIMKLAFKDLAEYELFRDSTTPRSRVEIVLKNVTSNSTNGNNINGGKNETTH